ncbi:MAG: ThiF family adenylyltransferase [Flavobacteriales bacterium]|nr:ThiF family adenylyltransferase [Flavobacteriales bacterium]
MGGTQHLGAHTSIAIVGAGGTGCALIPLLGALQVEAITVIDGDTVEAKNLARQLLYARADVGRPKVQAALDRMRPTTDHITWVGHHHFLDAANCVKLLSGHTVVADCTDDLAVRALIERTCRALRIPLVSGAVHGHQVQVITCAGVDHARRTFFQGRPSEDQLGCDMRDVPAAVTMLTGSLMALRITDLLNGGDGLAGVMDLVDSARGRWMRIMGPEVGEFMDTPIDPAHHA